MISLYSYLRNKLEEYPHENYPAASRIHQLNSFPPHCYVKREDELGFGISGSKFRKYRTLIPYIQNQGCKEASVIGGPFSNHVLSLTQLLLEKGIKPVLFLKGPKPATSQGNFLFLQMLVPSADIHWIPKEKWADVENIAAAHASGCIIPEGACLFPCFVGALTLPLDIIRNEEKLGFSFDSLYLDAGTGYSAAALLLAYALLEKQTFCHVMLLADKEEDFLKRLHMLHAEFEQWLGISCPFPTRFTCFRPQLSPSFGSTNQELFDFIVQVARGEGFFLDPIYSAKLFYSAKKRENTGKTLLVHSGGALTLTGFQDKLENSINTFSS